MKQLGFLSGRRSAGVIVLLFAIVIAFAFFSADGNIGTFAITLLSGMLRAMLLFLVAAGLSLIFGLMDILNFAQGAYFMIGAYIAYDVQHPNMGFLNFANGVESPELRFAIGILFAVLVGGALGWVLERVLLRPLYSRPLFQLVLTFGVSIILLEVIRALWGTTPFSWTERMGIQDATFNVFGSTFSVYRLFVIGMGLLVMAVVIILLRRSRLGITIRAGVQDLGDGQRAGYQYPGGIYTGIYARLRAGGLRRGNQRAVPGCNHQPGQHLPDRCYRGDCVGRPGQLRRHSRREFPGRAGVGSDGTIQRPPGNWELLGKYHPHADAGTHSTAASERPVRGGSLI